MIVLIHGKSDQKEIRDQASQVLVILSKILPSYVKCIGEKYALNKVKILEAVKLDQHPLDFKCIKTSGDQDRRTRFIAREKALNDLSKKDMTDNDDDLIKMQKTGHLGEITRKTICSPMNDVISLIKSANEFENKMTFVAPNHKEDSENKIQSVNDPWVTDNDIKVELDLINPMEHETEIDMNYSSARGYQDLYGGRPQKSYPSTLSSPPEGESAEEMADVNSPRLKMMNSVDVAGQHCGLGDGCIDASMEKVYVCSYCNSAFHKECGEIALHVQNPRCPACNALWN